MVETREKESRILLLHSTVYTFLHFSTESDPYCPDSILLSGSDPFVWIWSLLSGSDPFLRISSFCLDLVLSFGSNHFVWIWSFWSGSGNFVRIWSFLSGSGNFVQIWSFCLDLILSFGSDPFVWIWFFLLDWFLCPGLISLIQSLSLWCILSKSNPFVLLSRSNSLSGSDPFSLYSILLVQIHFLCRFYLLYIGLTLLSESDSFCPDSRLFPDLIQNFWP